MSLQSSELSKVTSDKNQVLAMMFEQKYGAWLGQRFFEVESHTEGPVLNATITIRNADKSFFYPIEGRMLYADQNLNMDEAREFLLDFMDAYVQEYLQGAEETYLTIDWSTYTCEEVELQLRGQILNLKIEELGDQLLNGSSTSSGGFGGH
jgi:hypothetical protein